MVVTGGYRGVEVVQNQEPGFKIVDENAVKSYSHML